MAEDSKIVSYTCQKCRTLFFSQSQVAYHKAMTGHGVYEEKITGANGLSGRAEKANYDKTVDS